MWLSRRRTAWRVLLTPEGGISGVSAAPGGKKIVQRGDCGIAGAVPVYRREKTPLCHLEAATNAVLGSLTGKMGDLER